MSAPLSPKRHDLGAPRIMLSNGFGEPSLGEPSDTERHPDPAPVRPFQINIVVPDPHGRRVLHELDFTHTPTLRVAAHDSATGQLLTYVKVGEATFAPNSDVTMFAISVAV